ncbi:hypothetical protein [Antarcticirhabdus aurantiaca]|uniref:Uncharacterized protein n=1 Tax=Antarcticirhabdus aurantiaca TaxID=2606717 RepID=A0ACD4NX69_9HYPH|nr:hypothetical protein [Antarcticirhabdus aurantiaca]WAJ31197.1 hypothetical protein OXU80_13765 [Jeongeuplla avenae]
MREREELIAENRRLEAEVHRLGALLAGAARMLRLAAATARCRTILGAFIRAAVEVERAHGQRPTEVTAGRT